MNKSRALVLALSLSVGFLGIHAGSPAAISAPVSTGSTAPPAALEVAQAPVANAFDVTGSGPWWKPWACWTCFGVGLSLSLSPAVVLGALVTVGCAKACL